MNTLQAALLMCVLGAASAADVSNRFCGGAAKPTVPSDLANVVGDQTLEYAAQQPANIVTCAKGYLLNKCGDHVEANLVFDKCIAAGYVGAMIWKAKLLEEGAGVEQDFAKATELLHRAAVSGEPSYGPIGKLHYATALYLGRGVMKDEAEGLKWFKEAAAEGNEEAKEFLKTGYHTGFRDFNTLGAGTPPAPTSVAALASLDNDNAGSSPSHEDAPAVKIVKLARQLVNTSAATPAPEILAPAPLSKPAATAPVVDAVTLSTEVQGQKLERREPAAAPSLPLASAVLGLLLLVSFLFGIFHKKRQDRPSDSHKPALGSLTPNTL